MVKIRLGFTACVISAFFANNANTQNIAINLSGSTAAPSSILEISSTASGLLTPRLTTSERNLIPAPALGLIIYNTTTHLFNIYTPSGWYELLTNFVTNTTGGTTPTIGVGINQSGVSPVSLLDVASSTKGLLIPRTTTGSVTSPATGLLLYNTTTNNLTYYDGTAWVEICAQFTSVTTGGGSLAGTPGIAINNDGLAPDISAILDINSSDKGILVPRLTNANRNALNPIEGLTIYNTGSNLFNYWNGTSWYSFLVPTTPGNISGSASVCQSDAGIIYSISAVPGATSYTWGVPSGSTITAGQGTTSITVTFGSNSGNISVTATFGSCTGDAKTKAVSVSTSSPEAPVATAASAIQRTQFTANWNSVAGATGYFLDVATDAGFTTFVSGYNSKSVGNVTTSNVTGNIVCNTTYYYRVRANNGCISPNSNTITSTTSICVFGCLSFTNFLTSNNPYATSIITTSDAMLAVAGRSESIGEDFAVAKVDTNGALQWGATIGDGLGAVDEEAESIAQTSDGGYVIAGKGSSSDNYIVKINSTGGFVWGKRVDGTGIGKGHKAIQSSDGEYVIVGDANDLSVIKINSTATSTTWSTVIDFSGYSGSSRINSILEIASGGFAITGSTYNGTDLDIFVLTLDASGAVQWISVIPNTGHDYGNSIVNSGDGGFVVAGTTFSYGAGSSDMYVVKLDGSGALVWTKTIGGTSSETGNSIIKTTDGGYAICGKTGSNTYLVKLTSAGSFSWAGGSNSGANAEGFALTEYSVGNYIVAGQIGSSSNFGLVKFTDSGTTLCCSVSVPNTVGTGGTIINPAYTTSSPAITITSHGTSTPENSVNDSWNCQ